MLNRPLRTVVKFVAFLHCFNFANLSREGEKRDDIDLQGCVDGFVVHKDKIIRTEDSREMGAKYLTEFDVENRQDCMRFCCETNQCDVFIFEEKKPGSCYLFQCGPPHDFKCKFTDHANYSSAVLTNIKPQNEAELEEQIRRNQQEHELKSLRNNEALQQEYVITEPAIVSTTQTPSITTPTTTVTVKTEPPCTRNQFACRSTGECIAIYNVCDGVPQCADSSDEAAELGCPTDKSTLPPPPPSPPPPPPPPVVEKHVIPMLPDVLRYQQMTNDHRKNYPQYPQYAHGQDTNFKQWPAQNSDRQVMMPQDPNYRYPMEVPGMPQVPMNYRPQGYQWEYPPLYDQNKEAYNSDPRVQNMPNYEQEQPHIFNHKGVRIVDENGVDGNNYVDPNQGYQPYYAHIIREGWQNGQSHENPTAAPIHQFEHHEQQKKPTSTTTPQPYEAPEIPVNSASQKSVDEVKAEKSHIEKISTLKKIKAVKESNDVHETEEIMQKTTIAPKVSKSHDHPQKAVEIHVHEEQHGHKAVAQHMRRTKEDIDEDYMRPRGAVISLSFGLTVTAIMAILITCRLRVVKRRAYRGREYAHDADYLVNGMYL